MDAIPIVALGAIWLRPGRPSALSREQPSAKSTAHFTLAGGLAQFEIPIQHGRRQTFQELALEDFDVTRVVVPQLENSDVLTVIEPNLGHPRLA